jgi:hypothetical protein
MFPTVLCVPSQIDDCKHFRQLHSKTPGHPENFETEGVEVTTGLHSLHHAFADMLHTTVSSQQRLLIFSRQRPLIAPVLLLLVQDRWARALQMLWVWRRLRPTWALALTSPTSRLSIITRAQRFNNHLVALLDPKGDSQGVDCSCACSETLPLQQTSHCCIFLA